MWTERYRKIFCFFYDDKIYDITGDCKQFSHALCKWMKNMWRESRAYIKLTTQQRCHVLLHCSTQYTEGSRQFT